MIIECAKFNKRSQLPDKPAEQFIASLYNLATNCNFGDLKDELIRDRIVVGIRDASLSKHLQMDPELTLEKAKRLVRQREAVHDQQHTLKREQIETSNVVDAISLKSCQNSYKQVRAQAPKRCSRCGKNPHTPVMLVQKT